MPFEAKRFRHIPVPIPELRISRVIAASPRQTRPSRSSQMSVSGRASR
jgi:hypothetical protein